MAIGFNPKYSQEFPLEDLPPAQFILLAIKAIETQNWSISSVSQTEIIAYTKFSWRSYSEEIKISLQNGTALVKSVCTGGQLGDWGKNKKNVHQLIATIYKLKSSVNRELLYQESEVLLADMAAQETVPLAHEAGGSFFSLFKPTTGYFVTPILVNLNILIFIVMCLSGAGVFEPDGQALVSWGANFRPMTLEGQWWRIITNCFIHIGIFHLLMNMYALVYIGILLEPLLGKSKFLLAYLLTGITASLLSLYWHDYTISAGASGAIFGLYGVFLAMLTTNFIDKAARSTMLTSISIFVGYNLLYGIKGNIDNAAHIGGLLGGMLIGYSYYPVLKNPGALQTRNTVMASLSGIVLLIAAITYVSLDNDLLTYNKNLEEFDKKEKLALEVYNMPEGTDKKQTLKKIKYGVKLWFENIDLTRKAGRLKLPELQYKQNYLLQKYCYSRVNAYNFMYKTIAENTEQYYPLIEQFNKNAETIVEELKTLK